MREIKFRVYDNLKKKMITESVEWNIGMILENKNDFELMQFTGLKDKNGKEIYEGDILEWYKGEEEVIFIDGKYRFGNYDLCNKIIINKNCKVIGNIYENSEKIKAEKE